MASHMHDESERLGELASRASAARADAAAATARSRHLLDAFGAQRSALLTNARTLLAHSDRARDQAVRMAPTASAEQP
jgi:hypothetical protein